MKRITNLLKEYHDYKEYLCENCPSILQYSTRYFNLQQKIQNILSLNQIYCVDDLLKIESAEIFKLLNFSESLFLSLIATLREEVEMNEKKNNVFLESDDFIALKKLLSEASPFLMVTKIPYSNLSAELKRKMESRYISTFYDLSTEKLEQLIRDLHLNDKDVHELYRACFNESNKQILVQNIQEYEKIFSMFLNIVRKQVDEFDNYASSKNNKEDYDRKIALLTESIRKFARFGLKGSDYSHFLYLLEHNENSHYSSFSKEQKKTIDKIVTFYSGVIKFNQHNSSLYHLLLSFEGINFVELINYGQSVCSLSCLILEQILKRKSIFIPKTRRTSEAENKLKANENNKIKLIEKSKFHSDEFLILRTILRYAARKRFFTEREIISFVLLDDTNKPIRKTIDLSHIHSAFEKFYNLDILVKDNKSRFYVDYSFIDGTFLNEFNKSLPSQQLVNHLSEDEIIILKCVSTIGQNCTKKTVVNYLLDQNVDSFEFEAISKKQNYGIFKGRKTSDEIISMINILKNKGLIKTKNDSLIYIKVSKEGKEYL